MGSVKKRPQKSLSTGRPPLAKATKSMSRKASRTLINKHHQLQKKLHQAITQGRKDEEAAIAVELDQLGGLGQYQSASLQGQSLDRGGDTSKILLEWLPMLESRSCSRPRMLELGALSTKNACSASNKFDMTRIDLNSQGPGIQQQDFMKRPLPELEKDRFDIISMSLVLNFVPTAFDRGEMLKRTVHFLRPNSNSPETINMPFPLLFLVLPRSCVTNSRYFSEDKLQQLMKALSYYQIRCKTTQKLYYTLWYREMIAIPENLEFVKEEINPGRDRNNFAVILRNPA